MTMNKAIEILESAKQSDVCKGDVTLATFYGTDTDQNGSVSAKLFVKALLESPSENNIFCYYIRKDACNDFIADVLNFEGESVFEVRDGISLHGEESIPLNYGFMRDKYDISGLSDYLRDRKVIPNHARILTMRIFEKEIEDRRLAISEVTERTDSRPTAAPGIGG